MRSYLQTCVERDIRQLRNITNLRQFEAFIMVCAARHAQELNAAASARTVGITQPTARDGGWRSRAAVARARSGCGAGSRASLGPPPRPVCPRSWSSSAPWESVVGPSPTVRLRGRSRPSLPALAIGRTSRATGRSAGSPPGLKIEAGAFPGRATVPEW